MLTDTQLSTGLISVWIIVLTFSIAAVRNEYRCADPESPHAATLPALQITGLRYLEYKTGGLAASIRADRLAIVPHRFLFFNLKSINEAHLENADIEIHMHDNASENDDMVPFVTDIFAEEKKSSSKHKPSSELGVITRSVVEGITVKIFNTNFLSITLRAKRAYVDKRKHQTRFQYATLEDARSDRQITSKDIFWDARGKVFLIPGAYIAETALGHARDKGARVNLNFVVAPL